MIAHPKIRIHLLPGGNMPQRSTEGAVGYDVHIRAIISPFEQDPAHPWLRKTLFNFSSLPSDPQATAHVVSLPGRRKKFGSLAWRLDPGESVLVGIGFIVEMPFPVFYWVRQRTGLSTKDSLQILNLTPPVDSDYRGEAGALIGNRGDKPFTLEHGMKIAQITFHEALIPAFKLVRSYAKLSQTRRGAKGYGSTGR